MNDYQQRQWLAYREKVIAADGHACTVCGAKRSEGAVLQVHHERYIPGLKPWDYPHEYCRTLCRGCHAAQHGHFPPKVGWVLCGEEDLGGLDGHCDVCSEPLRYVFSVFHPAWGIRDVGTNCCDRMTATSQASEALAERKRRAARLQTFLNSNRWRHVSATVHSLHRDGFQLMVRLDAKVQAYVIVVDRKPGKQRFATMDAAKERLFHILDGGALDEYRRKRDAAAEWRRWRRFHEPG